MPTVKKEGPASAIMLSADDIMLWVGIMLGYKQNVDFLHERTLHQKRSPNFGRWYKQYDGLLKARQLRWNTGVSEEDRTYIEISQVARMCNTHLATTLLQVQTPCSLIREKKSQKFHSIERCSLCKLHLWKPHIAIKQPDSIETVVTLMQDCIHASEDAPVKLGSSTWLFKGFRYVVNGPYTDEEFRLLVLEDFDKERRHFERLKQKHDSVGRESGQSRIRIPEQVRIEVWRRDGGKCIRCDSRENLEYDHIIPLSRGGSNTTRNVELLCEKCNRSKGASIG